MSNYSHDVDDDLTISHSYRPDFSGKHEVVKRFGRNHLHDANPDFSGKHGVAKAGNSHKFIWRISSK